jgi:hypothetical protein
MIKRKRLIVFTILISIIVVTIGFITTSCAPENKAQAVGLFNPDCETVLIQKVGYHKSLTRCVDRQTGLHCYIVTYNGNISISCD